MLNKILIYFSMRYIEFKIIKKDYNTGEKNL